MNQIVLDAQTQYNGSGLQKAVGGLKGFETEVRNANNAAQGTGVTFDGLVNKMQRPMGRVAFRMLASDLLMSQGAIGSLGGAAGGLAAGLRSVGMVAVYAGGTLAGVSIASIAIFEIWSKLKGASKDTAEGIKKHSEELAKNTEEMIKDLKAMKDSGKFGKETLAVVGDMIKAKETERKTMLSTAAGREKEIIAIKEEEKAELSYRAAMMGGNAAQIDRSRTMKVMNDAADKSRAVTPLMVEDEKKLAEAMKLSADAEERRINMRLKWAEDNSKALHARVNNTTKTILSMEKTFNESFAKMYVESHGNYIKAIKAGAAEELNIIAEQEATKLELHALADIFINPVKAIAEFAGATALRTFGAGVSSRFGAGSMGAGGGGVSAGSISPGATASVSNPADNRSPVTIHVQVMGNLVDHKQFITDLGKQISDMVENGGLRVIASDIKGTRGV